MTEEIKIGKEYYNRAGTSSRKVLGIVNPTGVSKQASQREIRGDQIQWSQKILPGRHRRQLPDSIVQDLGRADGRMSVCICQHSAAPDEPCVAHAQAALPFGRYSAPLLDALALLRGAASDGRISIADMRDLGHEFTTFADLKEKENGLDLEKNLVALDPAERIPLPAD